MLETFPTLAVFENDKVIIINGIPSKTRDMELMANTLLFRMSGNWKGFNTK